MRPSPATGKRWRRRADARPRELIDAALALFVERGFAATKLDDVALRAGVSKGTVYLYFDNKQALFEAVVREMVLPQLARVEEAVRHDTGPTAALVRRLVHDWWRTVGETQLSGIPKLVMAEAGNFPELARFFLKNVVRRARALFAQVLQRGVDRGEFRAIDVGHTVRVLIAPLVFAAIYEHSLRPYDRDPYDVHRYLDIHLELFLRGLAAKRGVS